MTPSDPAELISGARIDETTKGFPPEARFRSAIEVWGVVLSRPEHDLAIVGLGRRDVPFDQGYPRPLLVRRGLEEMLSIGGFVDVTGLNDQHAYCRVSGDVSLEVGDLVMFGISHPCSAFDRWEGDRGARRRRPGGGRDRDLLLTRLPATAGRPRHRLDLDQEPVRELGADG
ncbi:MAG TPA: hypothetical protein VF028_07450 [Actinomycetota bacterium]|jgi:Putative serine dehydratase domain|nr:hypothetical protein [Actinomycetota bacterium]